MTNSYWPQACEEVIVLNDPLSISIESASSINVKNSTPDYIRVDSIQGQEAISQPFSMTVQMRADDCYDSKVTTAKQVLNETVLGHWACLKIDTPTICDNDTNEVAAIPSQSPRFFRGIITELSMADPGCYTLTLASPLHLLTLQNRYHIYKYKDVIQLITQLLAPYNITVETDKITGVTAARTQDWLQAGETDMEFLQRIIAKPAIHYYFIHQEGSLTLVFSNGTTSTETVSIPGHESGPIPLRYTYTNIEKLGLQQNDLFCGLRYSVKMMPKINNTLLTTVPPVWASNSIEPYINTHGDVANDEQSDVTAAGYLLHRYYDYGAAASDPKQRIAIEQSEATAQLSHLQNQVATSAGTLSGTVTTPLLGAGYAFTLCDPLIDSPMFKIEEREVDGTLTEDYLVPPRGRWQFNGKSFVVTKIQHKISSTGWYSGTVEATEINAETFLTPFSMQGTHQGTVVAKVVADGAGDSAPTGWRFNDKNNFGLTTNSVSYSQQISNDSIAQKGVTVELATGQTCWVGLPATSQSIPEVGAIVMIGRSSNQSEQPELQQVLSSHGSKLIQPVDGGFSWDAHTNWGSHYSVNYGNSVSLSQGSFSMSNSEIGKSVNVSLTGNGDGLSDPASDYQTIKTISDSLSTGDSYNKNHTKGKSINLSGTGASPPDYVETPGLASYSNSKTIGAVVNNSVTIGAVTSNNVTVGATSNITTNTGAVSNVSVTTGLSSSVDTFMGGKSDITTFNGEKNEISIHNSSRIINGTHLDLYTSGEVNLAGKNENIATTGLNEKTILNTGDFTSSETTTGVKTSTIINNGAVTITETTDGAKEQTIINNGAVEIIETTDGAKNVTITNSGEASINETYAGVASITTEYVGVANIAHTFGGPASFSYTGAPCVVSDERILTETKGMVTQTITMLTIM